MIPRVRHVPLHRCGDRSPIRELSKHRSLPPRCTGRTGPVHLQWDGELDHQLKGFTKKWVKALIRLIKMIKPTYTILILLIPIWYPRRTWKKTYNRLVAVDPPLALEGLYHLKTRIYRDDESRALAVPHSHLKASCGSFASSEANIIYPSVWHCFLRGFGNSNAAPGHDYELWLTINYSELLTIISL